MKSPRINLMFGSAWAAAILTACNSGLCAMSKPEDEFGDRPGHKRADSIRELLLLVEQPSLIAVRMFLLC